MADSYQASLSYLYSLQLFGIKLGLRNIKELLARIGNPQQQLRIVHIAGTNGKGSTAAALANIFEAAGIPAGLYSSPHLHSFTERIRVATRQIAEADVAALTEELRPHAEELRTTFFEFTTALALLYFQRRGVPWAILEVGLGGRLDATNAVLPELCLLTPIARDHAAYLGNSLAEIAAEKAGICKPGVPVLSSRQTPAVLSVLQARATELQAPLLLAGEAYTWQSAGEGFSFRMGEVELTRLRPGLAGAHQQQNLALALAAAVRLRQAGVSLPDAALRKGVERVRWPGRLEWLADEVLLDGAHNPAGVEALAAYLARRGGEKLHLLVGMKADKQAGEMLELLLPYTARVYATRPPVAEAVDPAELVGQARAASVPAAAYENPEAALAAALHQRRPGEVLLVAGSLFLVARIRELLLPETELLAISA
jgi:dihydrofolate synthase/folylpolyglutamate synthase